jgi:hypothetical protein
VQLPHGFRLAVKENYVAKDSQNGNGEFGPYRCRGAKGEGGNVTAREGIGNGRIRSVQARRQRRLEMC